LHKKVSGTPRPLVHNGIKYTQQRCQEHPFWVPKRGGPRKNSTPPTTANLRGRARPVRAGRLRNATSHSPRFKPGPPGFDRAKPSATRAFDLGVRRTEWSPFCSKWPPPRGTSVLASRDLCLPGPETPTVTTRPRPIGDGHLQRFSRRPGRLVGRPLSLAAFQARDRRTLPREGCPFQLKKETVQNAVGMRIADRQNVNDQRPCPGSISMRRPLSPECEKTVKRTRRGGTTRYRQTPWSWAGGEFSSEDPRVTR